MENYFEQGPGIYFSLTDDGCLLDINQHLCSCLHYEKKELVGKKTDILFTVATRIFYETHFFPLLKMQGHAEEIFITLKKSNGDALPIMINGERRKIDGRAVILCAGIVVHNRKKFEDELIAAKKKAELALQENTALAEARERLQQHSEELDRQIQVSKKQNEEIRQFNRVVTHDMQEPIRKLFFFSNMALEDIGKPKPQELFKKMLRITHQIKNIVSGLQQYVWLTEKPLKIDAVDINKLLLVIKQQLEKEFQQVDLIMTAGEIPTIFADTEQLQLLFYQLLANAIQFRKEGNKAFVSVSATILQANQFRNVERYKYIDHLRIQVNDKGKGFDPKYKEQLFGLFKRLHPESGRGVGLSLCKKVADNHSGFISIESIEEEGTTVNILLPLRASDKDV
ncbi:MAG: ATP-binding protein [Flavisolibacter sp.]|jgi:sigma-B regulation protein RsbU (phosphoserine phosphatase)